MKREVWIQSDERGHLIFYCNRKPRGRYLAGQFNKDTSRKDVEEWVHDQKNLELVEVPEIRLGKALTALLAVP